MCLAQIGLSSSARVKRTMSHLPAKNMKSLNSNGSLKDNTNLELSYQKGDLKMSLSGKIMNISCKINLRAIVPVSNSLIFRPLYRMVVRFMLRKDSISLILAITRSGLLM